MDTFGTGVRQHFFIFCNLLLVVTIVLLLAGQWRVTRTSPGSRARCGACPSQRLLLLPLGRLRGVFVTCRGCFLALRSVWGRILEAAMPVWRVCVADMTQS